jgi:hypothetical protein
MLILSSPVIDWTTGPLTQVCKITIEPAGGILPDPVPLLDDGGLLLCNPQNATARTLTVEFQRGAATDEVVFSSTIQSIVNMMDPRFNPRSEDVAPMIKIRMFDGMAGLLFFIPLVSTVKQLASALD